ncbi:type II toxin-antitoxin system Phd/YefM family antitoxin [bacterium]|nr:type II toxin-antitoxin system Phd/YefM family antitoxin [bacterium]
MIINTKQIISMTEANQNFSKAVKVVDQYGEAIIMKNNKVKYIVVDVNQYLDVSEDEKILILAKRILNKHILAFKELAK